MRPYGLMADIHLHNWSAFSEVRSDGVNNRLNVLLEEIERCGAEVKRAGGDTIVIAGDLFHVRGSIAPSVLNPTMTVFQCLVKEGFRVIIIPGNHDLEGKDSEELSSAVTALRGVGCKVIHEPRALEEERLMVVPWIDKVADLKSDLAKLADEGCGDYDLIIHAPVNGVLMGIPDHGLDPTELAALGFRRVFAGHYHNHVDFGNGVYSIGALAHHTWSDVGAKAGFLIVGEEVTWHKSHAPAFVEITADHEVEDIPLICDRNFVRAKLETSKTADIAEMREFLVKSGAKGVVIHTVKKPVTEREKTTASGVSIQAAIADYIREAKLDDPELLQAYCERLLSDAEAV